MPGRKTIIIILAAAAVLAGAAGGFILAHTADLPEVTSLEEFKPSATTRVFSEEGELLGEFYMENRTPVQISQVPPKVINAFLAVEDPRFYRHSGIDITGIFRAMYKDIEAGRLVQGGSSITQQLAKMLFLEPEKSFSRKFKEAVLALEIERRYSKDEILALYLNQVYLGSGAYGIEAAARTYFGKDVSQLTLAEGAMLAGLPAAPTRYSPFNSLKLAYSRRNHVLRRMLAEDFITKAEMAAADSEPFVKHTVTKEVFRAPYFVEYIREQLDEKFGSTAVYKDGLNVYTTLNMGMQEIAEAAVQKGLKDLDKREPRKDQQIQGALLAIEPQTGYIKAMVGGRDFLKSEFNRSIQALRQPGSAFKPIIYAAALDKGYRPDDVVMDVPVSYPGSRPGELWKPTNFDQKFEGAVTLRRALARSINVVAVRLLEDVGVGTAIDYARRLGITSNLLPYLPLALGASDATLIEMTSAYAVFDNAGIYTAPSGILKITDREGRLLEDSAPATRQALSPDTAASMTDLLTGVCRFGTGWQASSLGRPVAGKTGTTSRYNDAWFIGYLPSIVTGVWVGYDDHKPIGNKETGARAALPVWLDFMKEYVKENKVPYEEFPAPPRPGFRNYSGLRLRVGTQTASEKEEPETMDEAKPDEAAAATVPQGPR
ncbi:MAG: PBP1A family penicillin-binding protein [Nitrospirota bacterium]